MSSSYVPPTRAVLLPTSSVTPLDTLTQSSLTTASSILQSGGLVAFPTETVYGLGASALSSSASLSIFTAKGRPADNPLIVHVSSLEMMYALLPGGKDGVPKLYEPLMKKFWPGPLSLIFPLEGVEKPKRILAKEVTAGHSSVAIRMPAHPLALALIKESNLPLAAPSANLSSRPSPTTAEHVREDLGEGRGLGAILDGGSCDVGVESTVVDLLPAKYGEGEGELRVLRAGGVSAEEIESCMREAGYKAGSEEGVNGHGEGKIKVYQRDFREEKLEAKPTTPGMKYKHYSPTNSRVVLVRPIPSTPTSSTSLPPSLVDLIHASIISSSSDTPRVGLMLTDETLSFCKPSTSTLSTDSTTTSSTLTFAPPEFSLVTPTILFYSLGSISRPNEAAQRLFAGLRHFDSLASEEEGVSGVDVIMVECVEETGVGLAVMERARKAAGGMGELEFGLP